MTWIEVVDTAIKIGLGALVATFASIWTLRIKHNYQLKADRESKYYSNLESKKHLYVQFAGLTHALIEKYDYEWCDISKDSFKEYICMFNNVQITCTDDIRGGVDNVYNSLIVFITFNKTSLEGGSSEIIALHDQLRMEVRKNLAIFQKLANDEVSTPYWKV